MLDKLTMIIWSACGAFMLSQAQWHLAFVYLYIAVLLYQNNNLRKN